MQEQTFFKIDDKPYRLKIRKFLNSSWLCVLGIPESLQDETIVMSVRLSINDSDVDEGLAAVKPDYVDLLVELGVAEETGETRAGTFDYKYPILRFNNLPS